MRTITMIVALFFCAALNAQLPSFKSETRKAPLSAEAAAKIGAEFSDFETVVFSPERLSSHLRENKSSSKFELQLGENVWVMDVESYDIRGEDYELRYADDTGIHILPKSDNITYKGYTVEAVPQEVRLAVDDNFIYGFVAGEEEAIFFQSQYLTDKMASSEEVLIFKGSDGILPDRNGCKLVDPEGEGHDHDHDHGQKPTATQNRRQVGLCFEVELSIASDFSMFQSYGSNVTTLENRNLAVMVTVNSDYAGSFADDYEFVVNEQFIVTTSGGDPWTSSTNSSTLLSNFRSWGPGGFSQTHDLGQLWTNRDFNGSTIGVAYVGGLCNSFRYHILEDFSSNVDLTRVLVSHEIGHNFDCSHDGSGTPFIMAPAVQFTSQWSPGSINTVDNFAPNAGCLSSVTCGGGGSNPPVANFSGGPTTICQGQTVTFSDLSSGATSYQWSFPGGTPATSTDPSPTITYDTPGSHNVTLTVTNANGTDTRTETNYVTVNPLPVVSFTYSIPSPLTVAFSNNSTGAVAYQWAFGDGTISGQLNPTHTYASPGVYNVILTAFNGCGSASETQIIEILIPPTAGFTSTTPTGCVDHLVSFADQSTGFVAGYNWSFPGGNPASSFSQNPSVVYTQSGVYDVTLTVANSAGSNTVTETSYIVVGDVPVASFSGVASGPTLTLTDLSSDAISYLYNFGDGTTSTDPNPSHTYAMGGTYTVTQTVTNTCGSSTSTLQFTIDSAPVPSFSVPAEWCINEPITVTSTSTGSPTTFSYTVVRPDGSLLNSTTDPFTFVPDQRGSYDIALSVTNATGQASVNVNDAFVVLDAPVTSFSVTGMGSTRNFVGSVSPVLSSTGASYQWDFGDGNAASGQNVSHTYAVAGNYTVTLTTDNGCESSSFSQSVTAGNVPTASITTSAGATGACPGVAVVYNANVSGTANSITWDLPGSTSPTATGETVTVNYPTSGSFSVSVEVCNAIGCNTDVLAAGITILEEPEANFTFASQGLLGIAISSNATGATNITYDLGDGTSSSDPNPNHTYTSPGTYTIVQTVSGPCGTDTFTETVTVGQAPTAGFGVSSSISILCPGDEVQFIDQSIGAVDTYAWSFPGGSPSQSSDPNPSVTYSAPGTYNVSLTVTNALGDDTVTEAGYITVTAPPSSDFASTASGLSVSFTEQADRANAYQWSFGDGGSSIDPNPTYVYSQAGTYNVTLTVTGDCGSDTFSSMVTVIVAPTAVFSASTTEICPDGQVSFDASASPLADSYAWTFNGATPSTSNAAEPTVTYTTSGTYTVQLIVSNSVGSDTLIRNAYIEVLEEPVANFSFDVNMLTVAFSNTSVAAGTSSWDFGDGNSSSMSDPSHTYASPGTYQVTLTVDGSCGSDELTRTVFVAPGLPNANIDISNMAGCAPLTTQFSAVNSTDADTYSWRFPGGSPATSTLPNVSVVYATPGSYDVELIVTNVTGTDTVLLTSAINVTGVPVLSIDDVTTTGFTAAFAATLNGASDINWDFGDGASIANGTTSEVHVYSNTGTYEVIATAVNGCGSTADTVIVSIGQAPAVAFESSVTSGCAPLQVELIDQSTGNPTSWLWTITTPSAQELTFTEQNPTAVLTERGNYSVSLRATNSIGSSTELSFNLIEVFDVPEVEIEVNDLNGAVVAFVANTSSADSINWSFGDGNQSNENNPEHEYTATGTYEVVLTATNSCGTASDTTSVTIEVSSLDGLPTGAELMVYPNPSVFDATAEFVGVTSQRVNLIVTDVAGRAISQQSFSIVDGFRQNLQSENWPAGVYQLRFVGETFLETRQFVKQ